MLTAPQNLIVSLLILFVAVLGIQSATGAAMQETPPAGKTSMVDSGQTALATFAGGCFWCMEPPFEKLEGVHSVVSGFSGGHVENPSYREASSGRTGHTEVVQITFDPAVISYDELLDVYWRQFDPTDADGSFVDRGSQYRPAIFAHDSEQERLAMKSRAALEQSHRYPNKIVTEIVPFKAFYPAEDYHQDYYKRNPLRYKYYRYNSGRDRFLDSIWGESRNDPPKYAGFKKPDEMELRSRLTDMQFHVTQEDGTEPAFRNEYWDNKQPGIYVDIVSGEPLFSSTDKYKSGTGWPSFTKPIGNRKLLEKEDRVLLFSRTEVRSPMADSHLGHIFNDGPAPTGLRYCVNSAALKFIPVSELQSSGYPEYLELFN